jgi:hypothetical protein
MTRKTLIILCAVGVLVFLVLYEVVSLYNTGWRPFLFLELALLFALLLVFILFRYDRYIVSFFEWMTRPRVKPPDFSCVRCQSVRVIVHERQEEGFVHRRFWCKDCGYEWSNIASGTQGPASQPDVKTEGGG